MPDDPRPRLSLRNLPPSKLDDEPTEPADRTTPPPSIFDALFPENTDGQISSLFGFTEKRSAYRMRSGHTRIPPRIAEKVEHQIALRRRLAGEILAAIKRAEADGIHVIVTRTTLRDILESEELDRDEPTL